MLLAFGAVFPRALKYICLAWMSVAVVVGFVMAHIILTLFFFLVITPIGLVAQMFGKDFLRLKLDKHSASYWIRREGKAKSAEEYEQQF